MFIKDIFKNILNPVFEHADKSDNNSGQIVDLVIGLDIGSSMTKVIIKQAYAADNNFYVVDFKEYGQPKATYLLPTHLCFDKNTHTYFMPNRNQKADFDDLKYKFILEEPNSDIQLTAFIAWVIKYSKNYFIEKYAKTDAFRKKEINWSINMGIPSAIFSQDGNEKWLKILENATKMYVDDTFFVDASKSISVPDVDLHVIPEIIATIKSFIEQDGANNDGLYCAVDIGATTLDVCTFRISNSADAAKYAFYKSSVQPYGAERYKETKDKKSFLWHVGECLRSVIWDTYRYKARYADEWGTGLPIFLCGGGSYMSEYKELLDEFDSENLRDVAIHRFRNDNYKGLRYIVLPDNHYVCKSKVDKIRLLVAQGLSYTYDDFDDIQRLYQECDAEDIEIIRSKGIGNAYVSKDMC